MKSKSICLILLTATASLFGNASAKADLISVGAVSSMGEANAKSGVDRDSWDEGAFGDYSASANTGGYTADASSTLSRSLNALQISASANGTAGSDAGPASGSFAESFNEINFTTSSTLVFDLAGSGNSNGGGTFTVGLRTQGGLNLLLLGESATLDAGNYQFYGYATAEDTTTGSGSSFATLSATLNVSAVPEPSGLVALSLSTLGLFFWRKRASSQSRKTQAINPSA